MDGRDIGSVVLPNADLKYYLHADINIRESRRGDDGEKIQLVLVINLILPVKVLL